MQYVCFYKDIKSVKRLSYFFCFMQTCQVLQRHMSVAAVCFAKVIASVTLKTLTTSVPVTGTDMKNPAKPRPLSQISGSTWGKCKINQCVFLNVNKKCA